MRFESIFIMPNEVERKNICLEHVFSRPPRPITERYTNTKTALTTPHKSRGTPHSPLIKTCKIKWMKRVNLRHLLSH